MYNIPDFRIFSIGIRRIFLRNRVMMRCKFLANIELCEEYLEHGGGLPLYAHAIKVRAHVWVFVHGVSFLEVEDKLSGGTVGVS